MASNKDKEENLLNEDENPKEDIAEPELDSEQESSADINDQDEIENLQKALTESTDQLLRAQAELQNVRRRSERDLENAHKYALERFSNELLPVMDNIERAYSAIDIQNDDQKSIGEGLELTIKNFVEVFKKFNISCVDPKGEPFDAELHQAVSMQSDENTEPNTVLDVFQKGYTLNGRLIRPAMVVVSKA